MILPVAGFDRTMMLLNCSTVLMRLLVITLYSKLCEAGWGLPPIVPAAISRFCSFMAAVTSEGVNPRAASFAGLSHMRIPKSSPRDNISPTPFTPVSYTHLRAHETDSYLVCRLL